MAFTILGACKTMNSGLECIAVQLFVEQCFCLSWSLCFAKFFYCTIWCKPLKNLLLPYYCFYTLCLLLVISFGIQKNQDQYVCISGLPSVLLATRKRYTLEIQFLHLGGAGMYVVANVSVPVSAAIFHILLAVAADCSNKPFVKKKKSQNLASQILVWNAWGIALV